MTQTDPAAATGTSKETIDRKLMRIVFALGLFTFGILHSLPGMIATARPQAMGFVWTGAVLWIFTGGGMAAAAYGLLGMRVFGKRWRGLAILGAFASLAMLLGWRQWWAWPAMVIDAAIISIAVDSKPFAPEMGRRGPFGWIFGSVARLVALAGLLYGIGVVAARPIAHRWGATENEIARTMPGDEKIHNRKFLINHVITVDAPPEKVWPWIQQIGQDKSGFYTYPAIDQAIGGGARTTYEIRPEWQQTKEGDMVRAVTPSWMGGSLKDAPGWRIARIEPNRLLLLDRWGLFWLEPLPGNKTRLGVRTDLVDIRWPVAPAVVFLFEPVHFLTEQKMLETIKDLSEKGGTKSGRP